MFAGDWAIVHGDAMSVLKMLPSGIAQVVCTSPPYYSLRDYSIDPIDWPEVRYAPMPGLPELVIPAMSANLGLEDTPEAYIAHLVLIFREVRRVLRDDGVAWVNIGDSYANASAIGLKHKDLMLIPARLALALQADGWWVRSDVIWHKPNPMPESVTDRPTRSHEHIFLLAKSERYYYDAEAIAEPLARPEEAKRKTPVKFGGNKHSEAGQQRGLYSGKEYRGTPTNMRNRRDVWSISPKSFHGAHFAVFPPELPDICIRAGTSERGQCPHCGAPWERVVERTPMEIKRSGQAEEMGEFGRTQTSGTMTKPPTSETVGWQPTCKCDEHEPVPQLVIDPFSGAGTTGLVATRLGRRYIGIEPNAEYVKMSEQRIINDAPLFNLPAKAGVIEAA